MLKRISAKAAFIFYFFEYLQNLYPVLRHVFVHNKNRYFFTANLAMKKHSFQKSSLGRIYGQFRRTRLTQDALCPQDDSPYDQDQEWVRDMVSYYCLSQDSMSHIMVMCSNKGRSEGQGFPHSFDQIPAKEAQLPSIRQNSMTLIMVKGTVAWDGFLA